jgi:maltooligosyltrehalose trehalohydrolase
MREFRVWAPTPDGVELLLPGGRLSLTRDPGGWWSRTAGDARPGTDYAFSLDGGPPRPDPRSAHQPFGVDGPSRVVDHEAFRWSDGSWPGIELAGSVIYELHVGTFSTEGTFTGVIDHLDHLVDLGVDVIELLPVAEFSGRRGWGYDGVDLFAPHHAYGGPDGLKTLIDAAHGRGLGVILDVVYNHLGPAGNYLSQFGPYFSPRHQTIWGDAVNFDGPGSAEVRRFVIDNALMWLRDYHCDGLRLDAVHAITDESDQHILAELAAEVRALACDCGRPLFLIAESDLNDPRLVRPPAQGGYGLDSCWADDWHHAVHATLTGERVGYYQDYGPMPLLAKALRQAWVYDGCYSPHRGRVHGQPPSGLTGTQFVVCTQNHDQVGNRAAGERLAALLVSPRPGTASRRPPELAPRGVQGGRPHELAPRGLQGGRLPELAPRLWVAAALLLTSPFVPLIFQGEEWGASTPFPYFTDHADIELGRAVTDGRRREFAAFGWDPADVPDPQDPATFDSARLDWAEPGKEAHGDLLDWYRELIRLRRQHADLSDHGSDRVRVLSDERAGWLVVRRADMSVAVNLGSADWTFPVGRRAGLLAASDRRVRRVTDGVALPPDTVAILAMRGELDGP